MSLSPQHEQMSLGSPSQSPPNLGSQYLPQFLQGDFHSSFNTSQVYSKDGMGRGKYNLFYILKDELKKFPWWKILAWWQW